MSTVLDREEYVEQAYFFRTFRERVADNLPTQDVLATLDQEILTTTRLPMAVQFLATEIKHTGLLATGFERLHALLHPVPGVRRPPGRGGEAAVQHGDRPARPGAGGHLPGQQADPAGAVRLPVRDDLPQPARLRRRADRDERRPVLRRRLEGVPGDRSARQVGVVDFADLVYYGRSSRSSSSGGGTRTFEPSVPMLFGEKEGKIAKASRGRDPLFLFAALQRQLSYPEVPRTKVRDDASTKLELMQTKIARAGGPAEAARERDSRRADRLEPVGKPDLLKDDDEK